MENNFRILKTGGELSSQRATPNNDGGGVNWPVVIVSTLIVAGFGIMMFQAGKNSIIPRLEAANIENEQLKGSIKGCPYRQAQNNERLKHTKPLA